MPQYPSNLLRVAMTVRSNPPLSPIDDLTGEEPTIWRGATSSIQVGIFDIYGVGADLTDLSFLQLAILPAPVPNQRVNTNFTYAQYSFNPYPTTPPNPLLVFTLSAASLNPNPISLSGWQEGTAQNATFVLDWASTQTLNCSGDPFKRFVYLLTGYINSGASTQRINYGGGFLTVYDSGVQGFYLPNTVTPIDVPLDTILYVEPNQQMLFAETISVEGTIRIEGIMSQVGGTQESQVLTDNNGNIITDNDGNQIQLN